MQGNIDFTGSLSGSIAGGGGGGSEVTITPTLQSGTKIADFSINSEEGALYAPTPEGLPATIVESVIRKYNDDTQQLIATVKTLDTSNNQEVNQDIYAPKPVQCWYTPGLEQGYQIGQFTYGGVTQNVYIPYFQRPLTAGTGISIDSTTDTISCTASGGGVDYSTTEQDTGITWVDGSHIYQRSFAVNVTCPYNSWVDTGADIPGGKIISLECLDYGADGSCMQFNGNIDNNGDLHVLNLRNVTVTLNYITVKYTKSV